MQGTKHQARRRLPASKLVIILMVCTQAVLYSGFAYLVMQGSTRAVRESEQDTFRMISCSIQRTIEHELDAAELALITALQNEQVVSIFAARDRDRLLTVMQPVYTSLSPRISHISFYLNDGTSFLRVQNPERFDNHIANSRDMAAAVLSAKKNNTRS